MPLDPRNSKRSDKELHRSDMHLIELAPNDIKSYSFKVPSLNELFLSVSNGIPLSKLLKSSLISSGSIEFEIMLAKSAFIF